MRDDQVTPRRQASTRMLLSALLKCKAFVRQSTTVGKSSSVDLLRVTLDPREAPGNVEGLDKVWSLDLVHTTDPIAASTKNMLFVADLFMTGHSLAYRQAGSFQVFVRSGAQCIIHS